MGAEVDEGTGSAGQAKDRLNKKAHYKGGAPPSNNATP